MSNVPGKKSSSGSGSGSGSGSDSLPNRSNAGVSMGATKPVHIDKIFGSPVSPLRSPFAYPATSSSSSSSGSGVAASPAKKGPSQSSGGANSGDLSGSSDKNAPRKEKNSKSQHADATKKEKTESRASSATSGPPPELPFGNVVPSGKIDARNMAYPIRKRDVLRTGPGFYGHGSIIRCDNPQPRHPPTDAAHCDQPERAKFLGNEMFNQGKYTDALIYYDRSIELDPKNAVYRSNRAAVLTALGKLVPAVIECEEAAKLDPVHTREHQKLSSLYLRLGHVENARKHYHLGSPSNDNSLQRIREVEQHMNKCIEARRNGDWKNILKESDAAITAGADSCSQLVAAKAEALLKLHRINDADTIIRKVTKFESSPPSCRWNKFFGMIWESYPYFVKAQIEMSLGRFCSAVSTIEKAERFDPQNTEIASMVNIVKAVTKARNHGNELFREGFYPEACHMYTEGLTFDPFNSVLYCNRAACRFNMGQWERSVDDCNQALKIEPKYTKALLRRAASNAKLERWAYAIRDYEILRNEHPDNVEIAESLFDAQVALKISRGEDVKHMKFRSNPEEITELSLFTQLISISGAISVAFFRKAKSQQCELISPVFNLMCVRYPTLIYIKIDIEKGPSVAASEVITYTPFFRFYKNGSRIKEMLNPDKNELESSIKYYSVR